MEQKLVCEVGQEAKFPPRIHSWIRCRRKLGPPRNNQHGIFPDTGPTRALTNHITCIDAEKPRLSICYCVFCSISNESEHQDRVRGIANKPVTNGTGLCIRPPTYEICYLPR